MSPQLATVLLCALLLFAHNPLSAQEPKVILFLGNSLSAGLGVDPSQAFPALIQKKIEEKS